MPRHPTLAHLLCALALCGLLCETALARGGRGGGGHGGGGGFHGGGGRPSMGRPSGGARPAPRPPSRPSAPRPSVGHAQRPGGAPRPAPRPGGGARPPSTRPAPHPQGPAHASRPALGGGGRPTTGNRPNLTGRPGGSGAPGARPGQPGTRPGFPTTRPGTRPAITQRPALRPGGDYAHLRPGEGTRPGAGGGGTPWRPGDNVRPSPGPFPNRPGFDPNRPGTRPNPNRPGPNRPDVRPNRPVVGPGRPGGVRPNRPIISGNTNINVNRPGWGYNRPGAGWGWGGYGPGRPGWGYGPRPGYDRWSTHWMNGCVNWHHHGWYHGCWPGHWGNNWYVPLAYGATMWGLGALSNSWGYDSGYSYSNPYYVASPAPVYDYSQPVPVQNYYPPVDETGAPADETAGAPAPPPDTPAQQAAYTAFDDALAAFKAGDFKTALAQTQQAIRQQPNDPVIHEFMALCYFALGQYAQAAPILNNLMAVAPGMDWTSLSGLYGNVAVYEKQLQALQDFCDQHPQDAGAHFVLAYHRLIAGDIDAAVAALRVVTQQQPKDMVAAQMLAALTAPPADAEATPADAPPADQPPATQPAGPSTDLVGAWSATRDKNTFALTLDEAGNFTWSSTPQGGKPVELKGTYTLNGDLLILESGDQGTMVAHVAPQDADSFNFLPTDAPPTDKGLVFQRKK